MESAKEGLKREIGVWGLSANLINTTIGASIFVMPAIVAEGLGAAGIVAYLFCGLLITLIMLCFAEAGSKIAGSGGAYSYIEQALGKYAGFLTAILFVAVGITADAAMANAIADIFGSISPVLKGFWVKILFFLVLFSGLALVNIKGVKQGIGLVKFTTIAKLIPLLLVILLCSKHISVANLYWHSAPSLSSVGEISVILFFAFQGGETGLAVSGEVKNPGKTIPRAILISISGVLLLYMMIQVVTQGVLGSSLPAHQNSPVADAANLVFGPVGFTVITVGMVISTFGCLSGDVLSIPRVLFGAARDRVIPLAAISKVHPKFATPYIAIVLYAGCSLFLASVGGFKQLAVISGISCLLIYLGVALTVIKMRKGNNTESDSFRIPGGYIVPIASILIILWLLTNLSKNEKLGILIFLSLLTLVYLFIQLSARIKQAKKLKPVSVFSKNVND
jgi:basic amino acid/polyamine antiporter, APA family